MRVLLGKFLCSSVEARFGGDLASVLECALADCAERIGSGPSAVELPVPRFWLEREEKGEEIELDVDLDPRHRRILEGEARGRDLSLDQLLAHAILAYVVGPWQEDRPGPEPQPTAGRRAAKTVTLGDREPRGSARISSR